MKTLFLIFNSLLLVSLMACGGGASNPVADNADASTPPANSPPTISGNYPTSINEGQSYDYTPSASDPDGDSLTFSINNKPGWAEFDSSTGRLSGTPTASDAGNYSDIVVSVSDGQAEASLPTFAILVIQADSSNDCSATNIHCVNVSAGDTQEFSNIQDAVNTASPGDLILVYPGNYQGFSVEKSGTQNNPISIKANGDVFLTSPSNGYANYIRLEDASYITIDGFKLLDDGKKHPYDYDYAAIAARGARANSPMMGLVIRNLEVANSSPAGAYFSETSGMVFENNYIHDNLRSKSGDVGVGVYFANAGTDNLTIRDNIIENNAGHGIHFNGDSSVGGDGIQSGHLIERNIINNNGENALNMDGVQSFTFVDNLITNNGRHGVRGFRIDASEGPANSHIINNTFFNNSGNPVKFTADVGNHTIFNNLAVSNGENQFAINESTPTMAANLFSNDNQLFVDVSGNDFRLSNNSLTVNAGEKSLNGDNAPGVDLNGYARDANPDLGAYELNSQ